MFAFSLRARRRLWQIGLAGILICFAWMMQLTVLSLLPLREVLCSVPMTVTIVWGAIFGSALEMPGADELRRVSLGQIIGMQAISGSLSGALVGAFFGSLYSSILPVYPVCYPIVGWVAGYFCIRSFNQGVILCIPLVLLLSVFGEAVMAAQMHLMHRPDVVSQLSGVAVPEAIVNAVISPFVYFPMRTWFEFASDTEEA